MLDIREFEAVVMLCLPNEERELLDKCFEDVAGSFASLGVVDTDGIEPMVSVLDMHSALREDVSKKHLTREEILSNAPEQFDGYFRVPGTID